MAVVYSKVLLFDPPLIYTAPDICVFGAVYGFKSHEVQGDKNVFFLQKLQSHLFFL